MDYVGTKVMNMFSRFHFRGSKHKHVPPEPPSLEMTSGWFEAVKANEVETVQKIIDRGVDINKKDQNGWNALHLAAWSGNQEVCELLLEQSDLLKDFPGPGGCTALGLSCQRGHPKVTRLLIKHNCNVNKKCKLGPATNVTAVHLAAQHGHAEIVKMLVKAGAHVNVGMVMPGVKGLTPLHLAVERNHMDVLDVLLEAGCDLQSTTQSNKETDC